MNDSSKVIVDEEKLISDRRVIDEINRHQGKYLGKARREIPLVWSRKV